MELADQLSLRSPLLWVTTDEPGRVLDRVAAVSERPLFRMDAIDGFVTWDSERNRWVNVLIDGPEGPEVTHELGAAWAHVSRNAGVMLIENAHTLVEAISGALLSIVLRYRQAFFSDDEEKIPAQFVLLSHEDQVPEEIRRMTAHITHELPDEEELIHLLTHITEKAELVSDHEDQISRAGLGLSETEFIDTSLRSIKEHGAVEPAFVSREKIDLLKRNGVLDVRTPKLTMDSLGGLDQAKEMVRSIEWLWSSPDEAKELGIDPLRRLLLVGVPGSGKSMVCEVIASMLDLDLGKGGVSNAMSKWVGESESNMRRMFASLKRMAPIVFWIDEFGRDMSGGMSSGSVDGGTTDRVHGEFLTGLQELPENVFLAAAANRIEDLPPEMTRADRFDRVMFVGFPTALEREEIFRIHLGNPHVKNYNITKLAGATAFFTGAEIKALIKEVRFRIGTKERRAPSTEELAAFAPELKGRMWVNHRPSIVAMYERALIEWDWASSGQRAEAEEVLKAAQVAPTVHHVPMPQSPHVPKRTEKAETPTFKIKY